MNEGVPLNRIWNLKNACENLMCGNYLKVHRWEKKHETFLFVDCHQSKFENASFYISRCRQSNSKNYITFRNFLKSRMQFDFFFTKKSNKNDVQCLPMVVLSTVNSANTKFPFTNNSNADISTFLEGFLGKLHFLCKKLSVTATRSNLQPAFYHVLVVVVYTFTLDVNLHF